MTVILVCALIFLIGRGLAWCINKLFRRRLLNTAVVGLLGTLPWALAPVYVLLTDPNGTLLRLSPEKQGELVASFVVPSAFVIGFGIWLAFRERAAAQKFTTKA